MSFKGIIYMLSFCLIGIYASAQKVRMGFLGGVNMALATYDFPATQDFTKYVSEWKTQNKVGFGLAYEIEYDFTDELFASSGLIFNNCRFDAINRHVFSGNDGINEYHNQFSIFELQLPLQLHYRMGKFCAGLGPFASLAFGGTLNYSYTLNGDPGGSVTQNLVFNNSSSEYADFRPLNAGLGAELAYGIKRWRIAAHLNLGLVNTSPRSPSSDSELQSFQLNRSGLGLSFLYQPWPR